ncbi:IS3 family transposase [Cetobacterium somerae]|uniref:IS3 family transposase n=1 Tax=Cetobacterium somerae TaxID=188913 RepID=UPI001F05B7B4|nr:IS3 family transposase [Cetobacterium somerae]MCQ9628523.1 IS3 family transposase [Cetobacterium somerae]UPO97433.1 IS3 family transposase [Cetobacterium somerae]UPO97564.1 IS3 family transposase [Cetobacterium somerae]UPO98406.1 IS3 family transposase [Cetobacterium somerae]UPO98836.1 IS3 family transposase [Cetobacterium somerae]
MVKKKAREIADLLGNPVSLIEENLYFSISEQCRIFGASRSSYYYAPRPKVDIQVQLKEKIKEQYSLDPSAGSRRITAALNRAGIPVKRSVIRRLMRQLNLKGIAPKRNLSKPKAGAQKFPYLLRNLKIEKPNAVWSTDITYLKTPTGFMYLTAIIDVYSRKILTWELSNSMSKDFCINCYKEAVKTYGSPEILNTDQGSQYTSNEFIETVLSSGALLSMDGKGRCLDNVWIERFWRTIKYDYLYLYEHKTTLELYKGIQSYLNFYNSERGHSSLGYSTPNEAFELSTFEYKKIA